MASGSLGGTRGRDRSPAGTTAQATSLPATMAAARPTGGGDGQRPGLAAAACRSAGATVVSPLLWRVTTSTLQQEASRRLGFGVRKTNRAVMLVDTG